MPKKRAFADDPGNALIAAWPRFCSAGKAGRSGAAQSRKEGAMKHVKGIWRAALVAGAVAAAGAAIGAAPGQTQGTLKSGGFHSRAGTNADTETPLKETHPTIAPHINPKARTLRTKA